jgi:hypothetical protein
MLNSDLLPHEALCLGMAKVMEMEPQFIQARWSGESLWLMALTLESEFARYSRLNPANVRKIFNTFFDRLDLRLNHGAFNQVKANHYPELLNRIAGFTCLADYFHSTEARAQQTEIRQRITDAKRQDFAALMKTKDTEIKELLEHILEANPFKDINRKAREDARAQAQANKAQAEAQTKARAKAPNKVKGRKPK